MPTQDDGTRPIRLHRHEIDLIKYLRGYELQNMNNLQPYSYAYAVTQLLKTNDTFRDMVHEEANVYTTEKD